MKKTYKREIGITLIALVITIIVLIILAGISITLLLGNNGIIKQAQRAKQETQTKQQEELEILDDYEKLISGYGFSANDILKMSSEEVKKVYGRYVTNYNPAGNDGIGGDSPVSEYKWQIFGTDGQNIYLVASDYINNPPNSKNQTITETENNFEFIMDKVIQDYEGSNSIQNEDLKNLNGNYYKLLASQNKQVTHDNMKAVSYMMDTSIWNPLFCDSRFASYAIGAPTLELLVSSYNKKYDGNYILGTLELNDELSAKTIADKGYYISEDDKTTWKSSTQNNETLSSDSIYTINSGKSWRMALASPCGDGMKLLYRLMGAGSISVCDCTSTDAICSFRPIVCLNSNVKIKKDGENYRLATEEIDEAKYEFEKGIMKGSAQVKEDENASAKKYVSIENKEDEVTVTVDAEKEGIYNINICYKVPYTQKVEYLYVNDEYQTSISLSEKNWTKLDCGTIKLKKGENQITIKAYWGWADFDYLIISPATRPEVKATQTTPSDKNATTQTKNLMSYLSSVYGNHIISGQQEIYKGGHGGNYEYEFDYIKNTTGKLPAIRAFDYIGCNPLNGYPDHITSDGTTDRIIDWVKNNNGIATASWHLVVPKDFANYTIGQYVNSSDTTYEAKQNEEEASTFDTSKAIVEGTKEYEYYQLCLKNIAAELKTLQDNKVPILFRPLHEAEGGGGASAAFFWWGKQGPEVYKELWRFTYETLTKDYGLHNIIWEWNSYNYNTSADWYPGDEYVDIIGYDKYISGFTNDGKITYKHDDTPVSTTFYGIMQKYNGKKMIAMTENDCFSTVQKLKAQKAGWLYFNTWYDGKEDDSNKPNYVTDPIFNTKEDMIEMYQSDYCITRDELPSQLYSDELQNF